MRVDVQQRRAAFVDTVAKRLLDAGLLIETRPADYLDDEVCPGKNLAVAADEVVVPVLVEDIAGDNALFDRPIGNTVR